ncbi:hypothetical protein [Leucobacter sp. 7(1)]|uniref:hypothetical protein n=1 Tax=Leucobacter sp. 7(1) TaxID=1255613 RepID=UPI00111CDAD8|nr:hypothetical protein [Leucobacter sp. 7(1)]
MAAGDRDSSDSAAPTRLILGGLAAAEAPLDEPMQRYRDAPREPEALLDYASADIGAHEDTLNAALFEWLLPLVADSSHPPELRAAAFEVLGQLAAPEGSEITMKRLDDERSVISFPFFTDSTMELVFSASGDLLEYRTVVSEVSPWLIAAPPGTVISSMTPRISVVDAVPSAD